MFFKDTELQNVIKLDLTRTYPESEWFQSEPTQRLLLNVLFTWCKLHPYLSYKQGMNELVAPLLWQCSKDAVVPDSSAASLHDVLSDKEFIEHDVFLLFERVMLRMECFFLAPLPPSKEKAHVCSFFSSIALLLY